MSPTVEPDPDNAGVGKFFLSRPYTGRLFLFQGSKFYKPGFQLLEDRWPATDDSSQRSEVGAGFIPARVTVTDTQNVEVR